MIVPSKLRQGDRVAIVAPSQQAKKDTVDKATRMISELGLQPVLYDSCYLIEDEKEVNPRERADDINAAFCDNTIKAIFSIKAGYGTMEVLPFIDFDMIQKNPKIFIGFSDITGIHLALNKRCDLVTYYGPLASSRIYKQKKNKLTFDPYTYDYLKKNLFEDFSLGIVKNPDGEMLECIYPGKCTGRIYGGNLTLLVNSLGTEFQLDTKGSIVFMEDMGESIDSIKKMLQELEKYKLFDECNGILLGTWTKCAEEIAEQEEREEKLKSMFYEVLSPYKKPILYNLRSGHNVPMLTIPLGIKVTMDTIDKTIKFY